MKCPFCYKKNLRKHEIIHENKDYLAFFSNHPVNLGHMLVIPKKHVKSILSLNDNETAKLFKLVKKAAHVLYKVLKPEGLDIGTNYGKIAGQTVNHLHIHIIPRYKNDLGFLQLISRDLSHRDSLEKEINLAQKLRKIW